MKKKIILSLIIITTSIASFFAGKLTTPTPEEPEEMTVDQQIDFVSTITDWNTDGNELAVFTSDGYEYYAQRTADEYTEKNYIPCDSVVDWKETENGLEITLKDGNVYTWENGK